MSIRRCYRAGRDGRPGWKIAFAYDEDIITLIKDCIPPRDRSWDPKAKEWWVSIEHEDALLIILPGFEPFLRQAALF